MQIFMGLVGVVVVLLLALALSENRRAIRPRTVLGALAIQAGLGLLVLYISLGQQALLAMTEGVQAVIDSAQAGMDFLFGGLVSDTMFEVFGDGGFVFALRVLPIIVFFSSLISVLYYLGVMRWVINLIGGALRRLLGTSRPESLSAAANIFVGQTEARSVEEVIEASANEEPVNVIEDAAVGASSGVQLAINIGGMLLAFIALIALANGLLGWVGGWFGYGDVTLEMLLGYLFSPLAFLIGVPWNEAVLAGSFIGEKLILNEFVAFADLAGQQDALSPHAQAIVVFALCGFANLSSIAILMGGLGLMAPNRRSDIARLGIKAVAAGTLSNLMSAALAGLFLSL